MAIMRRKLFNYHKFKRKFNRQVKSSLKNEAASRKDFAWHRVKANPFAIEDNSYKRKRQLQIAALIVSLTGMLGVLFFHPFFHLQNIEVNGLQRIDKAEFNDGLQSILNYKKFFFLPAKSYIMADVDEIKDILKSRFPIASIIVKKTFPNSLSIIVEEEISTIIYDNGREYSYLGLNGEVVEKLRKVGEDEWYIQTEMVSSTNELGEEILEEKEISRTHIPPIKNLITEIGDYPIVYYVNGPEGEINQAVLQTKTITGLVEWFNIINKQTDIPFAYIVIEDEVGDGEIKTREGWKIKVKISENIQTQFDRLQVILKEQIKRPNLSYIDLRYEGRVYWQ